MMRENLRNSSLVACKRDRVNTQTQFPGCEQPGYGNIKDNMMKKSIAMVVVLGCSMSVFAKPSFIPDYNTVKKNQLLNKAAIDVDFSGKWIGRCDGDANSNSFTIQQSAESLSLFFDNEKLKFMFNGVSSNDRLNLDMVYQEKYIADWDGQSQSLKLKIMNWGHSYNNFELALSQLTLNLNNNRLFIQNTHHALFSGFEDFQSGKLNCVYERMS